MEKADSILRFHRSERYLHWAIAIPFMVCYVTALILVLVYNPDPQRPFRALFSWAHRISAICLIVLPLVTLIRNRADYRIHLENIRQGWTWAWNDFKWLALSGLAAISSRVKLPEQGKFNAAEKVNFMVVMSSYPAFILTGVMIWLPGIAFISWMVHFALALIVTPLMFGHIFMAAFNPSTRVGLSGMTNGRVDREWAQHHYGRWYRENFEPAGPVVPAPATRPATLRCSSCGLAHVLTSWTGELCELLESDPLDCPDCAAPMNLVTVVTRAREVDSILQQLETLSADSFAYAPAVIGGRSRPRGGAGG